MEPRPGWYFGNPERTSYIREPREKPACTGLVFLRNGWEWAVVNREDVCVSVRGTAETPGEGMWLVECVVRSERATA